MTPQFGPHAREVLSRLAQRGAQLDETAEVCRVDNATCDARALDEIRTLAIAAAAEGFGFLEAFGDLQGKLDLASSRPEDVQHELVSIRLTKSSSPDWCYFITEEGFARALADEAFVQVRRAVWVATEFDAFGSTGLAISPWGGDRRPGERVALEQPRKLVRDLTGSRTPADLSPWYLVREPARSSTIFDAWQAAATRRLVYALPTEVSENDAETTVVIKGPRTVHVKVVPTTVAWELSAFAIVSEAARWVYGTERETETKFRFLNNHLALDWPDGQFWPDGLLRHLTASLTSARESYAFYLQDQSKDALKTLGDLRKSLQDEVSKAQTSTRDLVGAFWRDFAIAGAVLALRSPPAGSIANAEVLRWVTLGAPGSCSS
jgi:hypothetical protein